MFSNNLTMMTDLYELTMMQGYFLNGSQDTVVFDMFYRTNPSGKILVASMSNGGDVDALVKFTVDEVNVASDAAYGKGVATDGIPTADEVKEVFSVKFYYALTNSAADATEIPAGGVTLNAAGGTTTKIFIFAEATWTSDDDTIYGNKADLRDTYIGKYVANVVYSYTWEAVQATELP